MVTSEKERVCGWALEDKQGLTRRGGQAGTDQKRKKKEKSPGTELNLEVK